MFKAGEGDKSPCIPPQDKIGPPKCSNRDCTTEALVPPQYYRNTPYLLSHLLITPQTCAHPCLIGSSPSLWTRGKFIKKTNLCATSVWMAMWGRREPPISSSANGLVRFFSGHSQHWYAYVSRCSYDTLRQTSHTYKIRYSNYRLYLECISFTYKEQVWD